MKYIPFYDRIAEELKELSKVENLAADYEKCKAMAACYELLEYCSKKIAENGEDLDELGEYYLKE